MFVCVCVSVYAPTSTQLSSPDAAARCSGVFRAWWERARDIANLVSGVWELYHQFPGSSPQLLDCCCAIPKAGRPANISAYQLMIIFFCVIATYCVHCCGVSFWCEVVCSQYDCMWHTGRRKINCKLRDASRQFWLHHYTIEIAVMHWLCWITLRTLPSSWSSLLAWTVASSMVCQAMCGNLLPTSSLGRKLPILMGWWIGVCLGIHELISETWGITPKGKVALPVRFTTSSVAATSGIH